MLNVLAFLALSLVPVAPLVMGLLYLSTFIR